MIEVTFRPLPAWVGPETSPRQRSPFDSPWSRTLEVLDRELRHLDAEHVVIQVGLRENQIRLDGWPKDGAAAPSHPGVVVAFESRYGSLKYATDRFTRYQDNLRAIALGLESLRRVDRYGITKRGEQYTGWRQLTAGPADPDVTERGRELIAKHGSSRAALMATHPDHGGDPDDFQAVQAAREESD